MKLSYFQMVSNPDEGTKWVKGSSTTGQKVCPIVVMQNPNIICAFTLKQKNRKKKLVKVKKKKSSAHFLFLFFLTPQISCSTLSRLGLQETVEEPTGMTKTCISFTIWIIYIMGLYHFSGILAHNWGVK